MAPILTPCRSATSITSGTLNLPSGKSQRTCTATVGQHPVNRCTWPASLNFSAVEVAAEACWNLPKRVPVLAKPQEGNSMRKSSSAFQTFFSRASAGIVIPPKELRSLIIYGVNLHWALRRTFRAGRCAGTSCALSGRIPERQVGGVLDEDAMARDHRMRPSRAIGHGIFAQRFERLVILPGHDQ